MPAKRPSGKNPPRKLPDPQPRKGFVAVAFVRGAHGLRGEMAIDPMTDFPDRFMPGSKLWAAGREYTVRGARAHQDTLLVALEGIETRNQAAELRHQLLEVRQDELGDLEEDAYYRFEIIGLKVVDKGGTALGNVVDVLETGSNDVYIVRDAESEVLIPAIDSVVKDVDLDGGVMTVDLIAGLERRPLKPKKERRG